MDMTHKKKRLRIVHVNMLRRYHTTNSLSGMVKVQSTDSEDEDFEGTIPSLSKKSGSGGLGVVFGTNLDGEQQEQLREVTRGFADVLQDNPGRSKIGEHHIYTGDAHPIRQRSY